MLFLSTPCIFFWGADIIVFPEYGLFAHNMNRTALRKFSEPRTPAKSNQTPAISPSRTKIDRYYRG